MHKYLVLFFLIAFNANADYKYIGTWEGAEFNGVQYSSQVLQIDGEGNGFYIYSINGDIETPFYYSFKNSPIKFSKGYFVVPTISDRDTPNLSLLLTQNMNLNVLVTTTIIYDQVDNPFLSTQWHLVKTDEENIKNIKLYRVAKELYNKSLKQDK